MFTEIISTARGAIDIVRALGTVASIEKDAAAKIAIAELQIKLAEVLASASELILENSELKRQIDAIMKKETTFKVKNGLLYKDDNESPYCPTCHGKSGHEILLTNTPRSERAAGEWRCGACNTYYSPSAYRQALA